MIVSVTLVAAGVAALLWTLARGGATPIAGAAPAGSATPRASESIETTKQGPRIQIAAIGLDEPLEPQGLRDGKINPEPGQVIWYTGNDRAEPGSPGITVIAGHVTAGNSPDAFADLAQLNPGDLVRVISPDSGQLQYTVTRSYTVSKEDLQHDPAVWGTVAKGNRLVLVTCDDINGFRPDGHRVANLVVIATQT